MLTTDQKGVVAETRVAAEALAAGIGVATTLGDERYDLIFDVSGGATPRPMQMGPYAFGMS